MELWGRLWGGGYGVVRLWGGRLQGYGVGGYVRLWGVGCGVMGYEVMGLWGYGAPLGPFMGSRGEGGGGAWSQGHVVPP